MGGQRSWKWSLAYRSWLAPSLSKKSPFAIQKGLDGISKNLKSVKKLAFGDLLLETDSALQSKAFLVAKTFLDLPMTTTPHKTLNFCRGVVSDNEILFSSDEEILEGLSSQGVVMIKAGYINIRVRPYIPHQVICFKCQKFGHYQTACRGKQICSRCASEGHSYSGCQSKPNCANCHQAHESASKCCPKWIQEKKIQEKKRLTYSEARKLFQSDSAISYVQITELSKPAMSTQSAQSLTQLPCPPLQPIQVSPLNETPTGLLKQFSVSKTIKLSDTLSNKPDHPVAPSVLLRSFEVPVSSKQDGPFQPAESISTEPKRKQPFTGISMGDENVEIFPMKRTKIVLQSLESNADAEMSASTSDESDILEYNAIESLDDP
ncbi:hypothetical protein AVEN_246573-1 [Araneus ventricosus]|uniref:CCHC-type domain-containing protein n=1 Tax=Araneus ventricosus TaxID=182803 RepID=A0A4Y2DFS9_ARAVE|nr:hypothetical protein AVEN_246573-1 [Araneus ventricosus]